MKILTIKRFIKIGWTPGVLFDDDGQPFCLTLELPWMDNRREVSCIPKGEYKMVRAIYKNTYDSFLLQNVPNRDGIFIHKGNWVTDSLGCIILGEQFAVMKNPATGLLENSVASSGDAHNEFMQRMKGQQEATLIIQEV